MKSSQIDTFGTWTAVESFLLNMPRFSDVGGRAAHFALDQIQEFCEAIGNPQRNFKAIHVAGTNGKGTVCSTLSAIYTQSGYKTGLYTSPHLHDVRERIRINGQMIPRESVMAFFQQHAQKLAAYPLTFFELTTAIAFWYFSNENVDIAVIETGLGGRLDATNIIDPLVSVITGIGLDHQEQLGNSLASIAYEKAGIIKQGRPIVVGDVAPVAMEVIFEQCRQKGGLYISPSHRVTEASSDRLQIISPEGVLTVKPDTRSAFEQSNLRVISETIARLQQQFPVAQQDFQIAVGSVQRLSGLRGRFEKLHPDLNWYFDGAHNLQAIEGLMAQLAKLGDLSEAVCVFTVMNDKLTPELCACLSKFGRVYYHFLDIPRCARFESVKSMMNNVIKLDASAIDILQTLKSDLVLYTGSFYFYSTVSEWVGKLTDSPDS